VVYLSNFGLNEILNLLTSIIALIPTTILLIQYKRSKIRDFLLFGIFFLVTSITLVCLALAIQYPHLILYQLNWGGFNSLHFILFLHCIGLLEDYPKKIWKYLGYAWYSVLALLVMNWKIMSQPSNQQIYGLRFPHSFSSYYPQGAGYEYHGFIIYSSSYHLIAALFHIYVYFIFILVYLRIEPLNPTKEILLAKKLWIWGAVIGMIAWIGILPGFLYSPLIKLLPLISAIIVAYIVIRIPEAMLISYTQVLRASFLYAEINSKALGSYSPSYSMDRIIDYLNQLPTEILNLMAKDWDNHQVQ